MSAANSTPSLDPWRQSATAGSAPAKPLRAVGIVGAGKSATGIAYLCATHKLGVMMQDSRSGALAENVETIRALFTKAEERQEITHAVAHKAMGGISITTSMEDIEFCDIVIESKLAEGTTQPSSFAELVRKLPKDIVLASAESGQALEQFAALTPEPGRVIGLQFSDPIGPASQVQVTCGEHTSRETAERVGAFIVSLGLKPVFQGKAPSGA